MDQSTQVDYSDGQDNAQLGLARAATMHSNEGFVDQANRELKADYINHLATYHQMREAGAKGFPKPEVPYLFRVAYPAGPKLFPFTFLQDVAWDAPPDAYAGNDGEPTDEPELANPIGPLYGRSQGDMAVGGKQVNWYQDLSGYRSQRPSKYKDGDRFPNETAGRYIHHTWPTMMRKVDGNGKVIDPNFHLWEDTQSAS